MTTRSRPKEPPPHLSPSTKRFWRHVTAEYDCTPADLRVLQVTCEAWDRLAEARLILGREGVVYVDRFGAPRKHPAVAIEENARIQFLRAIRQLGLEDEAPKLDRRYRGNKHRSPEVPDFPKEA